MPRSPLQVPRSVAVDRLENVSDREGSLDAAVDSILSSGRSLRSGVVVPASYASRSFGARVRNVLGAAVLAGSLVACGGSGGPTGPGPSDPGLEECVVGSVGAQEYASSIGLDVDAGAYDSNADASGCFTIHERGFLDELVAIQDEGLVSQEKLQAYVDHFTRVGPMTVKALELTYEDWKVDRQFEDIEFNDPAYLGWVPLDVILPDASLPAQRHDDFAERRTNYPVNELTRSFGLPDLLNEVQGETETFLSRDAGFEKCSGTEDVSNVGSIDMNFVVEYDENLNPSIDWYQVKNGTLGTGEITRVFVEEFPETTGGPRHNSATVAVRYTVHPDDRVLFDADYVRFGYTHIVPSMDKQFFDESDFPFKVGDTLELGDFVGYVDPWLTPVRELDLALDVDPSFGHGPVLYKISGGERVPAYRVLDVLGGKYYPEGKRPLPTQPRYLDNRVHAPCSFDSENEEFVNLPDTY